MQFLIWCTASVLLHVPDPMVEDTRFGELLCAIEQVVCSVRNASDQSSIHVQALDDVLKSSPTIITVE